jgi:Ser/Thr protein kinase RdoA (MazF antagonist)
MDRVSAQHPYTALTPDSVMDALCGLGLWPDGRLMALGSYENRVYRVHLDEAVQGHSAVVVKFYRPGRWTRAQILEEHGFAAELVAAEVPVVAPLALQGQTLHHAGGFDFAVSPMRGGRTPELDDFEVLEWTGRFLARLHGCGAAQPFAERPALDIARLALEPAEWLLREGAIAIEVAREWRQAFETVLPLLQSQLEGMDGARLRIHGDCHPGNILWTPTDRADGGPHFVDLDDCCMGPAVQDLWMLLSGDRRQRTLQLSALLDGYEQLRDFDRRELAWIEGLRTLRLIHYSAWLARRWSDPTFPIHFPWFGTPDYWRGQVHMLHEQIEALQEAPLVV